MSTQGYSAAAAAAAAGNNSSSSSLNVHAAAFDGNFVLHSGSSMSLGAGEQNQQQDPTVATEDNTTPASVDSALLSAMRDPRERVALLKLEQAMLDFMRETDLTVIEVGGPYNSIVVGLAGSGSGRYSNSNNDSSPYGPNIRQTSFQRCWLHRLCDRFRITRETTAHSMDGLIRLLKQQDSCVPKRLLIDLEPSDYALNTSSNNGNSSDASIGFDGGYGPRLTQSMGNLSMGSSSATSLMMNGSLPSSTAKPGKMKIMKRNSSGSLNGQDRRQNNTKSASPRKSKKNLSDKEKEYAAARARIFNESETTTTTGGDPQQKKQQQTNKKKNGNSAATQIRPSQVSTSNADPTSPAKPSSKSLDSNRRHNSKSPNGLQNSSSNDVRLQRPKAATMGGVSKVTWRNRQKEEKDPDFQRGLSSAAPVYAPIAPDGGYYGGPTGYPPPTAAASPSPYGYPVNGQQQQQSYGGYGPSTAQPYYHTSTYGRGRGGAGGRGFRRSNSASGDT